MQLPSYFVGAAAAIAHGEPALPVWFEIPDDMFVFGVISQLSGSQRRGRGHGVGREESDVRLSGAQFTPEQSTRVESEELRRSQTYIGQEISFSGDL